MFVKWLIALLASTFVLNARVSFDFYLECKKQQIEEEKFRKQKKKC